MANNRNEVVLKYAADFPAIITLANEDPVRLEVFAMGNSQAGQNIRNLEGRMGIVKQDGSIAVIDESQPVQVFRQRIHYAMTAMMFLFVQSNDIAKPAVTRDYITGLRLHYGIENEKLILIYQPVLMTRNGNMSGPETQYNVREGHKYLYNQNNFLVNDAQADVFIANYRNLARIKRTPDSAFEPIGTEDCIFVTFSFQEILGFIYDNDDLSEDIWMYHAFLLPSVKHSLLFSYHSFQHDFIFKGMCADMAHLCPPHRDIIAYPLEN